ncbi:MAG TPA: hypothetical protein VLM78_03870, partial [Anaerolineales bacterium]|nr:hypothetical protein [Anaerolineales bacterium]
EPTQTLYIQPADTLVPTTGPSPTNPPLPPLPGFDQLLSFGPGGAEDGFCRDWGDATECYFPDTPAYDSTTTLSQVESVWSAPESLNVIGRNFPANALVYILLYVEVQDPSAPTPDPSFPNGNYQFIYGQVLVADSGGFVNLPLIIQLESGKQYLLVASTDPDGNIQLRSGQAEEYRQSRAAPWVIFSIPAGSSSCPGAPPQRITVNQRGYVCTGSDPVCLRVPRPVSQYACANIVWRTI